MPSACSSRTMVASVKGRRPPSAFSRVDRLTLALSASHCRDMRRRAISSRTISATCRLWSSESCLSGVCIGPPDPPTVTDAHFRTNPDKAARRRERQHGHLAEQGRSFCSQGRARSRTMTAMKHLFRERKMPAGHPVTATDQMSLARTARLLLVFLLQSFVVLLAGFAALLVDFEPSWSAEGPEAPLIRPGDARSGSLLLKSDDGYSDAARLGIDVDLTVSG